MIGQPHTDADELHQEMHETFVYSPAAVPRNIIVACEDLAHTHFATINKKEERTSVPVAVRRGRTLKAFGMLCVTLFEGPCKTIGR